MIIIGIDPGYDRLGVAVIKKHLNNKEELLFSDCLNTDKRQNISDRIYCLGTELLNLLEKYKPDLLAIETIFFNKNQKTVIGVSQIRGVVLYLAKQAGCKILELGPQQIKIATTGYGKSDKQAVLDMVKKLVVNAPQKALDDEYDAIAIAFTASSHTRLNLK